MSRGAGQNQNWALDFIRRWESDLGGSGFVPINEVVAAHIVFGAEEHPIQGVLYSPEQNFAELARSREIPRARYRSRQTSMRRSINSLVDRNQLQGSLDGLSVRLVHKSSGDDALAQRLHRELQYWWSHYEESQRDGTEVPDFVHRSTLGNIILIEMESFLPAAKRQEWRSQNAELGRDGNSARQNLTERVATKRRCTVAEAEMWAQQRAVDRLRTSDDLRLDRSDASSRLGASE